MHRADIRVGQFLLIRKDLDGFQKSLCSCALDKGSLSIGSFKVKNKVERNFVVKKVESLLMK